MPKSNCHKEAQKAQRRRAKLPCSAMNEVSFSGFGPLVPFCGSFDLAPTQTTRKLSEP
jgi:hypothetical protein